MSIDRGPWRPSAVKTREHSRSELTNEAIRAARPYGLYAYRQRETVFATIMADRVDWDAATRAQRHLGVAADAELRRRHPDQHFFPLRSAEPEPATESQRAELTLTEGQRPGEMGQWITDLAAAHRTFAERLADRQSLTIPAEDSRYGDLG